MKVIAINGSPRKKGNTSIIIEKMAEELAKEGIETEAVQVGDKLTHGCISCYYCRKSENHLCVFKDDLVNEVALKMREADGIILGAPTYYAEIAGAMRCFLDRVFYSSGGYFAYKVGASFTTVRRAGGVGVIHQLNNYFQLAHMVTAPTIYWPAVYGRDEGEVFQDAEGMYTVLSQAKSMAWLLKTLEAGKGSVPYPDFGPRMRTNFIR